MSNTESMHLPGAATRKSFQGPNFKGPNHQAQNFESHACRVQSSRPPAYRGRTQSHAALPPVVEQTILFGFFAAAAGFWGTMIWWIVR